MIIDAHFHFSNIEVFKETALLKSRVDYSKEGYEKECRNSKINFSIGMGLSETEKNSFPDNESENPMVLDLVELPKNTGCCLGINPYKLKKDFFKELEKIEKEVLKERVLGFKIYAGYYPFYVYETIYHPIYKLAEKYDMPVVIHAGDTYSERGLLKYSHPIHVDETAVQFRNVRFVISHLGDPWVLDTAEIISKNSNVYADLSGLLVGDESHIKRFSNERLFIDHFRRGIIFSDNYEKFIFGTDWPLVPIKPYIEFIKILIPERFHGNIFCKNAFKVFPKLMDLV